MVDLNDYFVFHAPFDLIDHLEPLNVLIECMTSSLFPCPVMQKSTLMGLILVQGQCCTCSLFYLPGSLS